MSVTVLSFTQIDALFRSQWQYLTDALQRGDTAAALNLILPSKRAKYQMMFNALGDQLPAIVAKDLTLNPFTAPEPTISWKRRKAEADFYTRSFSFKIRTACGALKNSKQGERG